MSESGNQFRTAAFGGFHKQDVLDYITRTAKEHQEKIAGLQQELEQARAGREELAGNYGAAEEARKKAAAECERLSGLLTQRTTALEQAERELSALKQAHAAASAQLEELKAKVPRMEEDAAAYAELKDRLATIELEAHRAAQETVARAEARAAEIRGDLEGWVKKLQGGYQRLRADMTAALQHLSEELERSRGALAEPGAMFQEWDEQLGALLEAHGSSGPKPPLPLPLDEETEGEAHHG